MLSKRTKQITIILVLLLIFGLTGCTERGYEAYQDAVKKTDEVNSGVNQADIYLHYTFDKTNLTDKEISELENYEELSVRYQQQFNKTQDKYAIEGHINFGGLGFDGAFYKNEKGHYIFLPLINRYIQFEEMVQSDIFKTYTQNNQVAPPLSEATLAKLQQIWLDLLAEDNVFTGAPVLMETPDGELKASVYEITLTPEQIDRGLKNLLAVVREDKEWVAFMDDQLTRQGQNLSFDELLQDESWSQVIESGVAFKYTSYVDRDGYIIKEHITADVTLNQEDSILKSVQFGLESTFSNRDQVDEIEIPLFSEENTMRPEKLKEWIDGLQQ